MRQHSVSVKMRKGGSRSRIGKIISRYVNSLYRGNRTLLGRGNTFLKGTKIGSKGRLVTDSRRDTSQQSGYFRTSLGETENVVNEQKYILSFNITEVFRNGQTNTGTSSRRFVHLAVYKSSLGSFGRTSLFVNLDHTGFNHFEVKIVTFTGTFTDTGENGYTTVVVGNVVNKFHDNNGLTDTSTTEQTNLTTLGVRSQKINNLHTGYQNFSTRTLLSQKRSGGMDR